MDKSTIEEQTNHQSSDSSKNGEKPFVSVIIPCRNEENFIANCLDSIISQDYPKDRMEILVVDGMSEDKTREIITNYTHKSHFIKLLDNPKRITPCALNIGIKEAKGEFIVRIDAHAKYQNTYISKLIKYITKYNADNIGGIAKASILKDNLTPEAITIALSHPFGTGNSYFRIGVNSPKEVDTVFGGCFRKEIFNKIGLFNENLARNQDFELNTRLRENGGKIILAPDIVTNYYPKQNFWDFFKHDFKNSFWITYQKKYSKGKYKLRHISPLIFAVTLITMGILGIMLKPFLILFLVAIGAYVLASVYFSIKIAIQKNNLKLIPFLASAFACRHTAYGTGSIWGLIKVHFPSKQTNAKTNL